MKLYAIRHKVTGGYLPAPRTKHIATTLEPAKNAPPRLFMSKRAASLALKYWLEGHHFFEQVQDDYGCEYDMVVRKQEHRKAEDMEIVEVSFKWRRIK